MCGAAGGHTFPLPHPTTMTRVSDRAIRHPRDTLRQLRRGCTFAALVLLMATAWPAVAVGQPTDDPPRSSGARALMGRLVAPCCWRQTVDTHDSDLAAGLRREIYVRLNEGEGAQAIEDDFVRRYGSRVLALPGDTDPSGVLPVVVGSAMAGVLFGLIAWVRLGRRDERDEHLPPRRAAAGGGAVDYGARLDDELARQDL